MKILNKTFYREFEEIEKLETGIALIGSEVKSIRENRMILNDAFVKIIGNELFLINAQIPEYEFSNNKDYDPKRSRKLLVHKREIIRLQTKLASGGRLTIVPVSCYNRGRHIKLEIALARPRKEIEKKKLDKTRDIVRDQKREMKEYTKQ